jgi:hypothetical protein
MHDRADLRRGGEPVVPADAEVTAEHPERVQLCHEHKGGTAQNSRW